MQRIFFIVLGLFLTYALNAQELGTVQGFLFDRETGEPVQFSTLFLKGTRLGTTSDITVIIHLTVFHRVLIYFKLPI